MEKNNSNKKIRSAFELFKNFFDIEVQRNKLNIKNSRVAAKKIWNKAPQNFKKSFVEKAKHYHGSSQQNEATLRCFNGNNDVKAYIDCALLSNRTDTPLDYGESSAGLSASDNIVDREETPPPEPQVEEPVTLQRILIDPQFLNVGGPFNHQDDMNTNGVFDVISGNNSVGY
ncbi:687_t:CDS:1 [Ambispora gerdemannii]|uniref:687_t:CDS:1 n=1 Tax=Ambispora gerdemannii TaxID=144530 RepID=A0A9N9FHG4_9GLOM|nr:687_t:CDS:1 [Ambispora gerdemannii]